MALPKEKLYTADEFFAFTEESDELLELVEGEVVAMASPSEIHQDIIGGLYTTIYNYIRTNKGSCKPLLSPFDVKLDDYNVVIPDVSVVCDRSKLDGKRCNGSPDWIIEVVSSNRRDDYVRKLALYEKSGVREYWIVDPKKNKVVVYYFEENNRNSNLIRFYEFSQTIPVNIYKDNPTPLEINISELLNM
jgi:Uma2 family endonuclease